MSQELASKLIDICRAKNLKIATAESCTGGLVAATLTEISGASDVFDRGFVTYSNQSKIKLVGVPKDLIETHGAVSEEVSLAMADGAAEKSGAQLTCSVTGIAGPNGGTEEKPVGLVYISSHYSNGSTICHKCFFDGERSEIRDFSTREALKLMLSQVEE